MSPTSRHTRSLFLAPTLLILSILLGAVYLRAHNFDTWPPGLSHDEAINGIDALRLWRTGRLPLYLSSGRAEPLFRFVQAITVGFIGPTRFGLRLASLYTGVLAVAAAYRAGRHVVPPGDRARRWVGLLSAGTLAVLVGHIHLSRVAYRAIPLPLGLLLFVDAFVAAWQTGRRRAFGAAGVWLAICVLSYTSGLAALPVAALGILQQLAFSFERFKRRWRGLLIFGLVFLVAVSPMIIELAVQPETYGRIAVVSGMRALPLNEAISRRLHHLSGTWQTLYKTGDINPQYNVYQTPLLHMKLLYVLLLIGVMGCALRPRHLVSWLALGMLGAMLLPVALSNEIPHGLRISGEYGAVPLVIAASATPILWLARRLSRPVWLPGSLRALWSLSMSTLVVVAGVRAGRTYFSYYQDDIRWGDYGAVSAFSWFFETKRLTIAEYIAAHEGVVYVPLTEVDHPSMRYFTVRSHPQVATFATYFALDDDALRLPAGQFVIVPWREEASTFAAFMPDGTLVLLPRFDDDTLAGFRAALAASEEQLFDDYSELAATVVSFPPGGHDILLDPTVAHRVKINYANQVTLTGWDAPLELPTTDESIDVTLYFAPGPAARREPGIFTQLWTLDAQRISSSFEEPLLSHWVYPLDWWEADDIVPYVLGMPIPEGLSPGAYHVAVGLYGYRGEPLPVLGAEGTEVAEAAVAGAVKVPHADVVSTEGMIPVEANFGDAIMLLGYRLVVNDQEASTLTPGQTATVVLYWQALRRPSADYTIFVHVWADDLVAQNDSQPEGGRYPTSVWSAGEIVATYHPVTIPEDVSNDTYTLYVGLYSWPGMERLPAWQDGIPVEEQQALLAVLPGAD